MRRSTFALGCAAALAFVVAGAAHGAEPVKIRASWVVAPSDWTPLLLEKPDLMKHQGKSYVFEPMRFQGTPAVITALANNELELGNLAFSSLALAIQNAGLEDLRIVGDQFKDGAEGHYTNQFFVLKDSPVQKVADLKGRIVATNAAGSAVDIAMRAMLRKHGLEDKRDYTMIEAPFPTMKAMLVQKKADLAPFVAQFSFDPELKQIGRPLFAQKDAIGTTQMIVWVARKGFLEKNRAAMVDFMEDSLRVVRWYLDPKNHGEAAQIAARVTKQPPERFTGWLFTADKDYARSPDLLPDLAALQANIEVQRDLGFLKGPIDVQKYVDLSIVREAATRLK
jgi:ABC-type nitrate/sulfonate/bicarbonate transport system substrate-binding protein